MDCPICKICGHRHWSWQPHVWKKPKSTKDKKPRSANRERGRK